MQVTDNAGRSRFEMEEQGETAFADYLKSDEVISITHVETPPALRGKGVAGRLMDGVLAQAREAGLKVRPLCGYAADFMDRHPENDDLRV